MTDRDDIEQPETSRAEASGTSQEQEIQEELSAAPAEDPQDEGRSLEPVEPAEPEGQTMESLLDEQNTFHTKLMNRDIVWVKVVQVTPDQVLVDIGEKNEGWVPASEFPKDAPPAVGRRIPAVLVRRGAGDRGAELSTAKAKWRLGWEQAVKAHEEKARVRGKVVSSIKGGFLVDVGGVTAFMPSSLSDLRPVRKPEAMIGTGVRCYIIELNKEKGQVIVSRKAVLEEESVKRKEKVLSELKPGQVRVGRVNRVNETGAFVDIGGIEGIIHTADVAWKNPEEARAKLERGQKVRVRILKVEADKVSLGMKQLTPHPGDALRKKYPVKATVKGVVSEVLKEGVRIKLEKGDNAFCPVEELQTEGGDPTRGRHDKFDKEEHLPPIWPKVGEAVSAMVIGIQSASFEPTVSIRRYESIQERKRVQQYMKGAPPLTLGQLLNPEE